MNFWNRTSQLLWVLKSEMWAFSTESIKDNPAIHDNQGMIPGIDEGSILKKKHMKTRTDLCIYSAIGQVQTQQSKAPELAPTDSIPQCRSHLLNIFLTLLLKSKALLPRFIEQSISASEDVSASKTVVRSIQKQPRVSTRTCWNGLQDIIRQTLLVDAALAPSISYLPICSSLWAAFNATKLRRILAFKLAHFYYDQPQQPTSRCHLKSAPRLFSR